MAFTLFLAKWKDIPAKDPYCLKTQGQIPQYTVKPLNKGHFWSTEFARYSEASSIQR